MIPVASLPVTRIKSDGFPALKEGLVDLIKDENAI
jgi:hypothetical protein